MKRNVGAVLWLLAAWTVVGTIASFEGWPGLLGPAAGLVVGALVWSDPGGRIWQASTDAALRRRRLADLPRVSESSPGIEAQRGVETAEG